jgi:hypothetical protein
MTSSNSQRRTVTILRWVARVWSIPILIITVLIIIAPDPNVVQPVPLTEWIELSLFGLAILGLLIAWRWEGLGGILALTGILAQAVAFRMFRGVWFVQTIPIILLGAPAVFFLVAWWLSRDMKRTIPAVPNEAATLG